MTDRLLLTAVEAAEALAMTPWSVRDLARRGELPSVRLGRRVRFPKASLEAWIDERTRYPRPHAPESGRGSGLQAQGRPLGGDDGSGLRTRPPSPTLRLRPVTSRGQGKARRAGVVAQRAAPVAVTLAVR